LGALNDEITRQATIIAYMDDFKLMLLVSLPSVLLLLLMRKPRTTAAARDHVAVVD
jgi:MFS transporter, DHA2 family, multidrug resistance protein